jgi:hypothetical protein
MFESQQTIVFDNFPENPSFAKELPPPPPPLPLQEEISEFPALQLPPPPPPLDDIPEAQRLSYKVTSEQQNVNTALFKKTAPKDLLAALPSSVDLVIFENMPESFSLKESKLPETVKFIKFVKTAPKDLLVFDSHINEIAFESMPDNFSLENFTFSNSVNVIRFIRSIPSNALGLPRNYSGRLRVILDNIDENSILLKFDLLQKTHVVHFIGTAPKNILQSLPSGGIDTIFLDHMAEGFSFKDTVLRTNAKTILFAHSVPYNALASLPSTINRLAFFSLPDNFNFRNISLPQNIQFIDFLQTIPFGVLATLPESIIGINFRYIQEHFNFKDITLPTKVKMISFSGAISYRALATIPQSIQKISLIDMKRNFTLPIDFFPEHIKNIVIKNSDISTESFLNLAELTQCRPVKIYFENLFNDRRLKKSIEYIKKYPQEHESIS